MVRPDLGSVFRTDTDGRVNAPPRPARPPTVPARGAGVCAIGN